MPFFIRSEATRWFIENQINREFGNSRADEIELETVNNFVNNLALPGYFTNDRLLSIPYYYMLLPNLQLLRYINSSTFRNSSKSLLDRPFAYQFNVTYLRRKRAAQEAANRTIQERNAFDPNELTVDCMLNRPNGPNVWVGPAWEEPNDQFVVKNVLFECHAVDRIWTWVTGFDTSKKTPLTLIANANLKGEKLMKINRFLFCLIKLAGLEFSNIEYQKPGETPPVVLQDRDIAMMLQRIRNDSGFWFNR
ncbi:unnamed protein product [Ambrosiozyma monospora]|uniref:Unnamed protein product n=1 Tax=Ambrosiozyma monospora TaxID=43982 RepID=A0ACB5SVG6_AMBMO|nr:unnamed protein product [Ambrosiozyma monospora]